MGPRSVVHRDIVRRNYDRSDAGDSEAIAVNGCSRRELITGITPPGASSSNSPSLGKKGRASGAARAGRSLGFDLGSSLAAIDQWVQDLDPEDAQEPTIIGRQEGFRLNLSLTKHIFVY